MNHKGQIAVFLSGRGSNFEAIYKNSMKRKSNFSIAAVISDHEDAKGLTLARELNLNAYFVSPELHKKKEVYEKTILEILESHRVELICLAGYMRLIGPTLLAAFKGRIINIHPSLLPSFPGLHAQQQAIDYGAKVSGCTVHFVDNGMDTGPIILQKAVDVLQNDTEDSLGARILKEEHILYSQAIQLFFENKLKFDGRRIIISL